MIINGKLVSTEQLEKVYNGRVSLESIDKDDVSRYTIYLVINNKKYKIELNSQEHYAYQSRFLTSNALQKLCLRINEVK